MDDKRRKSSSATREILQYLNVDNAKLSAFVMVICCIAYHGTLHARFGGDSCHWLLSEGRFQGDHIWQPFGCMIHKYTKTEARNCLHYIAYWGGDNNIAFVGDSRVRSQYYSFVETVTGEPVEPAKVHGDMNFHDPQIHLNVDFIWAPIINETVFTVFRRWAEVKHKARDAARGATRDRPAPTLVITGSGPWTMKFYNGSMDGVEDFKTNLTLLVPTLKPLENQTKILWMLQERVDEKLCINKSRSFLTNKQVQAYNAATLHGLEGSNVKIWRSSKKLAEGYKHPTTDGLHLSRQALTWDSQILMNMYCNDHMKFDDGTCCSGAEPVTVLQIITASLAGTSLAIALCMYVWRRNNKQALHINEIPLLSNGTATAATASPINQGCNAEIDRAKKSQGGGVYEFVVCLGRLGIIMIYFFLCDRTNFFMKENKYYTHVNFFLPFSYLMIVGIFFTETSKYTWVMHRDQTDEWKGWMQVVILIYHLTGASKVLVIYMQIRVLVSSYLFLSGFGHFYYFFAKADYSIHRFCAVMFRFNFLVVLLCFTMNRPYQFYYFVPLVSFWFLLCYLVMAVWPRVNAASTDSRPLHYVYMVFKIALLVTAITLLYASQVLFEDIFLSQPIKPLFTTADDSVSEWRFRWKIDRYSTVFGMAFAFLLLVAKKVKMLDDSKSEGLLTRGMSWLLSVIAVSGIAGYFIFASFCRSKEECNEIHSYISFVPIVSFIFLRNLSGWLRTKYSTFFAWFGRISLELFIAQYHIWLASDTHGVLVLVPNYPVLNLTVTSFIFVCAAHEIHVVTSKLVPYFVPIDWKPLLRNIIMFFIVLLPLAITRGVFG